MDYHQMQETNFKWDYKEENGKTTSLLYKGVKILCKMQLKREMILKIHILKYAAIINPLQWKPFVKCETHYRLSINLIFTCDNNISTAQHTWYLSHLLNKIYVNKSTGNLSTCDHMDFIMSVNTKYRFWNSFKNEILTKTCMFFVWASIWFPIIFDCLVYWGLSWLHAEINRLDPWTYFTWGNNYF